MPFQVRVEQDVPARMRDGTILRADVAWPVAEGARPETSPVLLTRTAYQKRPLVELAAAGYIAVSQDVRGRYASDGVWEPYPGARGPSADDWDGFDTVLWAAGLPQANGAVGVFGYSNPAREAWALAITRPPPLVAMYVGGISVTSTAAEAVPRLGRRLEWFIRTAVPEERRRRGLPGPATVAEAARVWGYERHKWLWHLPWSELPEHLLQPLNADVQLLLQQPEQDRFRFAGRHGEVDVPIFHRTGWYDYWNGTIDHFTAMRQHGRSAHARQHQYLLIGPWGHGGALQRQVGEIDFGPEAERSETALMLAWFDRWLKEGGREAADDPPVRYFVMGRNCWRSAETWPPPETAARRWYVRSGGGANTAAGDGELSRAQPATGDAPADTYRYDPRDPVPTVSPPNHQNVPLDHRAIDRRPDLLVYVSGALDEPVEMAGTPVVTLYAASSAADTDFIARLADVHPDGYVRPLCAGIVRARFRDGYDAPPRRLTPGSVERYEIRLSPVAHAFLEGHRIRLEVTSSDFPNYDRNHNTGGDDFSDATLIVAEQSIRHSAEYPSHLSLPVVAKKGLER